MGLHLAACFGAQEAAKFLLGYYHDYRDLSIAIARVGRAPLSWVARYGRETIVLLQLAGHAPGRSRLAGQA